MLDEWPCRVYWFLGVSSFSVPVKCAEAGCVLEVSFPRIFTYSCYFGRGYCYFGTPKRLIWKAWCQLGGHFPLGDTLGPSEQQERNVGTQNDICIDFGMISGSHFESFSGSDGLNYVFC